MQGTPQLLPKKPAFAKFITSMKFSVKNIMTMDHTIMTVVNTVMIIVSTK